MAGEKEIILYDVINNKKIVFSSLKKTSDFLGVKNYVLSKHILKKPEELFLKKYIVKYTGVKSAQNNYVYNIGDIISDEKGKIEILEKLLKNNKLCYKYKCLLCGNIGILEQNRLIKRKQRCSICCKNPKIVTTKNCMNTTHSWIKQYLKDEKDGETYTSGSNKKIFFKCPYCGEERYATINKIIKNGYNCHNCGDGISYPNRLMKQILIDSKIDFVEEKKFEWLPSKRYDFYIESKNIIIEMDGSQHLKENIKNIDMFKENIAYENGIKKIIRVNAYKSDYKYIENELEKSKFFENVGIPKISIKKCDIEVKESSLKYRKILELWERGNTVSEISKILNIKIFNVRNYIKKLQKIDKLQYNGKEEINKKRKKKVIDTLTDTTYDSILDCSKKLKISRKTITNNLKKRFIIK